MPITCVCVCVFLRRFRIWRCTRKMVGGRGPSGPARWEWFATRTRVNSCAAGIRWQWISRISAGTGLSRPRSTRPTTVPASVQWCSCRSIRTRISPSWPTKRACTRAPGRAARPAKWPPYRCCISTRITTSFTACYPAWWWNDAVAVKSHVVVVVVTNASISHYF